MHRIGMHLPPAPPLQTTAAKTAKEAAGATRTLSGKSALDPFADIAEDYGPSDRTRRQNDPNRFTARRNPPRSDKAPVPEAFSGEIESLFAAALGKPQG